MVQCVGASPIYRICAIHNRSRQTHQTLPMVPKRYSCKPCTRAGLHLQPPSNHLLGLKQSQTAWRACAGGAGVPGCHLSGLIPTNRPNKPVVFGVNLQNVPQLCRCRHATCCSSAGGRQHARPSDCPRQTAAPSTSGGSSSARRETLFALES